ncbi:hypothetical protein [Polyangium aurulentum]|uniref:hypothetical protein n=1 Tax=Polyangium aurulentum TaxID=2567896 RepID=UPI0010AED0D0|nr:hypothetical protein [Polyangium aurulentum]UQA59900.1 hypothetical protein E8A73_005250 [Polyangium aurulentum]
MIARWSRRTLARSTLAIALLAIAGCGAEGWEDQEDQALEDEVEASEEAIEWHSPVPVPVIDEIHRLRFLCPRCPVCLTCPPDERLRRLILERERLIERERLLEVAGAALR